MRNEICSRASPTLICATVQSVLDKIVRRLDNAPSSSPEMLRLVGFSSAPEQKSRCLTGGFGNFYYGHGRPSRGGRRGRIPDAIGAAPPALSTCSAPALRGPDEVAAQLDTVRNQIETAPSLTPATLLADTLDVIGRLIEACQTA